MNQDYLKDRNHSQALTYQSTFYKCLSFLFCFIFLFLLFIYLFISKNKAPKEGALFFNSVYLITVDYKFQDQIV